MQVFILWYTTGIYGYNKTKPHTDTKGGPKPTEARDTMVRPNVKKGTRVKLVSPTNALEGIEPDPLPLGSLGSVDYAEGNFATVRWDNGYTLTHLFEDLTLLGNES